MKEQILAYHETGHLLLNVLVRKLNLKANVELEFVKPKAIKINPANNSGEITNGNFPISEWTIESLQKISNFTFTRENFYPNNLSFVVAQLLIIIGGHTVESYFLRPERLKSNSFGNEPGEIADKRTFDLLVNYIMKGKYFSMLDKAFLAERDSIINSLRNDIISLIETKEVGATVHFITESISKKNADNNEKKIDAEEFLALEKEINKRLEGVSIEKIIAQHVGE